MSFPGLAAGAAGGYGILDRPAPELEVATWIDRDGQPTTFSIADSRGKWIFLKCFQNWCPGCHKYGFPTLKKIADAFEGMEQVAVVGIQTVFEGFSVNTESAVRELQLRYRLPITMGHDPGDPSGDHRPGTMKRYRTGGTPWMVVIDPDGRVVYNDFHIDADRFIEFLNTRIA